MTSAPPLLIFDTAQATSLDNHGTQILLSIPSEIYVPVHNMSDPVSCKLGGVIYHGLGHFTARLIVGEQSWKYDGNANRGTPILEGNSSDIDFRELDSRYATVMIYHHI
jgi:hypothetical protein